MKSSFVIRRIAYQLLCHLALLANLIYLTNKYFSYDVDSNVGFYTPVNITLPKLSLCFDLNTIIGGHERIIFHQVGPQYKGYQDKYIFRITPGAHEIVTKCALRDETSDQMKCVQNAIQCLDIFNIERYRMQGLMCYRFQVKEPQTFSFNSLVFSLNEPRLLYKLVIGGPLNKGHAIVPLIHFEELADVDRTFLKELFPSRKDNEIFYLEYDLYEISRLPHPYTTKCGPDPLLRCYYKCLAHLYAQQGLVPSTGISYEHSNTSLMLAKFSVDLFRKFAAICRGSVCKSEACQQKLTITHISGPFESKSDKLAFNIGTYKFPINKIVYSAKLPFIEYATQCFGLSGIWVGFSVISCITRKKRLNIMGAFNCLMEIRVEMTKKLAIHSFRPGNNETNKPPLRQSSKKASIVEKAVSVLYKLTIVIVFSVQATNLCIAYFKYQTVLHHDHIMDPEFYSQLPSTVICIDLKDLFADNEPGVTEENYEQVFSSSRWTNLTLSQIFNQTMGEEVLFKCRTSDYEDFALNRANFRLKSNKECLTEFSFHKYYSRWQMCYLFTPKSLPRTFSQWEFVSRGTNPAKLYSLILNPQLKDFGKLELVVYFDISNASYSSSDSRTISSKSNSKRTVILAYNTFVVQYLPSPYDTRCLEFTGQTKCRHKCFTRGLRDAGLTHLAPYSNTILEAEMNRDKSRGLDPKLMSFHHLKNKSINDLWNRLEHECPKKCSFTTCSDNYTMTYSSKVYGRGLFDVELIVNVDAMPRTLATSVPRFPFYDFYYQMFCLMAFWLGFSFIRLDIARRKREKRLTDCVKLLYTKSTQLMLFLVPNKQKSSSSNRQSKLLFVKKSLFHLFCVVGMCFHLIIPFVDYLSYPTILLTTTTREVPKGFTLVLCSEAQDLYERGIIFPKEQPLGELFDKNLSDILIEARNRIKLESFCGYWGLRQKRNEINKMKLPTDRIFFRSINSSLCEETLVKKISIKQGHVCFHFGLNRKFEWTRWQMLNSLNGVKKILIVTIDSSLISQRFTVIGHMEAADPYHSSVWTPTIHKVPKDSWYIVSQSIYILVTLPHPFSDKGLTQGHITRCFYECSNSKLGQSNLTRVFVGDHLQKSTLVSNSIRAKRTLGRFLNEVDKGCDRRCSSPSTDRRKAGEMHFTVSWISEPQPFVGPKKGLMRFDLRRTDDQVITMTLLVSIFLYDLVINVGSIISIWFGLSVIEIPNLITEEGDEQIHNDTLGNIKRIVCILEQLPDGEVRTTEPVNVD